MLRCIAIDDEPFALKLIEEYCAKIPQIDLVDTYHSSLQAKEKIPQLKPDLVFLDINMPDLSGIDLFEHIPEDTRVIFTTAYDEFAVVSYRLNALDYLLKPFNFEDFLSSINKAKAYFDLRDLAAKTPQTSGHIFVKSKHSLVKIILDELLFIENLKDYVRFYLKDGSKVMSLMSLKSLEEKLPEERFIKVHRSYIIGVSHITSIQKKAITINNHNIPVSNAHKHKLHQIK